MRLETAAVHFGYVTEPTTKAVAVPIYQTVAYEFDNARHGADLFNLDVEGNIYNRMMNPTNAVLERRVAALEGGCGALAVGSGAAAITYAILCIARTGHRIVSVPTLYGATYSLFAHVFRNMGIEVDFASSDRAEAIAECITADTQAVYCESIGNPAGNIVDLEALADVAHSNGIPLIVDNTVATPALLRPFEHGADVVVHSLTKYLGGHGAAMGGLIVDSGLFPWERHADRYPMLTRPEPSFHDTVYTETFGPRAYVERCRTVMLRNTGATLAPHNAFLILQGVETLPLRMERHCANAEAVVRFLQHHPRVAWVNYAGCPGSPWFTLANRYLRGKAGALLTFGVRGGYAAGERFYDSLRLVKRLVNIGDTKTLACHPASTTHRNLTDADRARAGVSPEMLRLCVGIEHIDDIVADLDRALAASEPDMTRRCHELEAAST